MRQTIRIIATACLALLAAACATHAPPITKLEARSIPGTDYAARVRAQLVEVYGDANVPQLRTLGGPHNNNPPRLMLTQDWFWSAPRPSTDPGLCESEWITVSFVPDTPASFEPGDASTPVHASTMSRDLRYAPATDSGSCDNAPPELGRYFSANSPADARTALHWMQRLRADGVVNDPAITIGCGGDPVAFCMEMLRRGYLHNISYARPCPLPQGRTECLEVAAIGGLVVKISRAAADPGKVTVEVDEMVVTSHARLD